MAFRGRCGLPRGRNSWDDRSEGWSTPSSRSSAGRSLPPGPPTATSTRSLWRSASTWRPCGSMSPLTIQEPQTHQGVLPASAAPALHPPPCSRASHAICHHGVLTLSRGRHRQCRQSPSDRRDACRRCCCLHRAFSGHCCIALCINRGPLGVHSLGDEGGVWSLWRS